MTDWKTIKIPAGDYERHNNRRQDFGETWAEYIAGQAPGGVGVEDIKIAMREVLDEREDTDEASGLMDAMNESDAGCPECGAGLVHEMGSEAKRCPSCGWVEGEE